MIEPNGPLPQYVYWRRRAFAAGASVLAVVMLAWIIGGLVEADDQHPVQGTSNAAQVGVETTGTGTGTATATAPAPSAVPSGSASAPPSSPGPNDPRGSVTTSPGPAVPPTTAPPTTTPPTPAPPQACPDAVVKVVATPDVPSYPVGAKPLLHLAVSNMSAVPCTRDVSRKLREIVVQGMDGTRLWSSNDCYGPPEQDVRLLAPKQTVGFSVNWAGRTSAPGCPENRTTVPAGTYQVIGKLGALTGAPTPLTLT